MTSKRSGWLVGAAMAATWALAALGAVSCSRAVSESPMAAEPAAPAAEPVPGPAGAAANPSITHGPSLQLPEPTAVTISWHTERPCVSHVEYGLEGNLDRTAFASEFGLIPNGSIDHVVRLAGLEPGALYSYRVVSREFRGYVQQHIVEWGETVASDVHTFRTLDPGRESFSFAVISDLHEDSQLIRQWSAGDSWRDADFIVFNGDMINDFMREDQVFTGFLDASVESFARSKPIVYARGNHGVRGRFARRLGDFMPTLGGRTYYAFTHGDARIVVLDSGEDKEDGHEYYNGLVDFDRYLEEQGRWFEGEVDSPEFRAARHRIVISHIPPRNSRGYGADRVRRNFEAAANRGGVDLWLSGHTHRFSRLDPVAGENGYTLVVGARDTSTHVEVGPAGLAVRVDKTDGSVADAFTLGLRR